MLVPMVQIARFFDSHQPGWGSAEGRGSLDNRKGSGCDGGRFGRGQWIPEIGDRALRNLEAI